MAKKNVKKSTRLKVVQKTTKKTIAKKVQKSAPARTNRVKSSSKKRVVQKSKKTTMSLEKGVPMLALSIFATLFAISLFVLFRQSKITTDALIVHDVTQLKQIMESVHKDCKIIDLEHTKNYVDFLTVEKFVGSEIGAVNLSYPQNWKGPYVKDNPTVQQQQYIILKNKNGYYIVPGDGVTLGNGKKVGKDIVLDENSDVEALLQDSNALKSTQGSLGIKVDIGSNYIQKVLHAPMRYL